MKNLLVLILGLILISVSACQNERKSDDKVLASYSLAAGEERELSVPATKPKVVGWRFVGDLRKADDCPNHNCATLFSTDEGRQITGWYGGGMEFNPHDGKINLKIRNLAPFQIDVKIYER